MNIDYKQRAYKEARDVLWTLWPVRHKYPEVRVNIRRAVKQMRRTRA